MVRDQVSIAIEYLKQAGDLVSAILAADVAGEQVESEAWLEAIRQLRLYEPPKPVRPTVLWDIGVDHPIGPDESLPEPPEIPVGAVVVLSGRAPIWRYAMAFHRVHGSPAGAVACYDPRLGNVIVASHVPDLKEGDVV